MNSVQWDEAMYGFAPLLFWDGEEDQALDPVLGDCVCICLPVSLCVCISFFFFNLKKKQIKLTKKKKTKKTK